MRKYKKVFLLIIMFAFSVALIACSGSETEEPTTNTTETPTTEAPTTEAPTTEVLGQTLIADIEEAVELSVVDTHRQNTIFLDGDQVFTKGDNRVGELGDGTFESKDVFVDITNQFNLDANDEIISVRLGEFHGLALSQNGRIFTWGHNSYGKLGIPTSTNQNQPVDITDNFELEDDERIIYIVAGRDNNAVMTNYGRVFTFGVNSYGQLGNGEQNNPWEETIYLPQDITHGFNLVNDYIIKIELGNNHSMALSKNGQVFAWGYNDLGQLGTDDEQVWSPINITDIFDLSDDLIIDVEVGYNHSGILSESGRVFVFGDNSLGQLGIGSQPTNASTPIEITNEFESGGDIYKLRFSHESSAVIGENYTYVFGYNVYGQLGLGNQDIVNTPSVLDDSVYADKPIKDMFIAKETFTIVFEDDTINSVDLYE
ncbi:MAG: RCC1 domain-containing protein [Candidatus Izemoplasmatales bacterium]